MRVLFIDHELHKKTVSSNFFIDILSKNRRVDKVFFDPEKMSTEKNYLTKFEANIPWNAYDLVVVWQLEVLGLLSQKRRIPTLLIPMYDGCANFEPDIWKIHRSASILHFSYTLFCKSNDAILNQKWVQYFPNPEEYNLVDHSNGRNVFFWMRRPEDLGLETVLKLIRSGFDRLHVHLAPDDPTKEFQLPDWMECYNITTSTWFNSRAELDTLLNDFNIMICPRMSEGIGMGMLEGMARGMCVIAARDATHTEYISDKINGFLFDRDTCSPIPLSRSEIMGKMARKGIADGYIRWIKQIEETQEFIDNAQLKAPQLQWNTETCQLLIEQYFGDIDEYYKHVRYLNAQELETIDDTKEAFNSYDAIRSVISSSQLMSDDELNMKRIDKVRLAANKVPGWNNVKDLVPVSLKNKIARMLAEASK